MLFFLGSSEKLAAEKLKKPCQRFYKTGNFMLHFLWYIIIFYIGLWHDIMQVTWQLGLWFLFFAYRKLDDESLFNFDLEQRRIQE